MENRVLLAALVVALSFSVYMTLYTANISRPSDRSAYATTSSVRGLRLTASLSYNRSTADEIATLYVSALGDKLASVGETIRLHNCYTTYFETDAGNLVHVGECMSFGGRRLGFLFYDNIQERSLEIFSGRNAVDSVLDVLSILSSTPHLNVSFILEKEVSNGFEEVRGHQSVGEWKILWSGFFLQRKLETAIVRRFIVYDVYSVAPADARLPPPSYKALRQLMEDMGITYRRMFVEGLRVCGGAPAYSFVILGRDPLIAFQGLVDAYSGDVLLLAMHDLSGSYKIIRAGC